MGLRVGLHGGEGTNLLPVPGFEPRILRPVTHTHTHTELILHISSTCKISGSYSCADNIFLREILQIYGYRRLRCNKLRNVFASIPIYTASLLKNWNIQFFLLTVCRFLGAFAKRIIRKATLYFVMTLLVSQSFSSQETTRLPRNGFS